MKKIAIPLFVMLVPACTGPGVESNSQSLEESEGSSDEASGQETEAPSSGIGVMFDNEIAVAETSARWLASSKGKKPLLVASESIVERGKETFTNGLRNGGEQSSVFVRIEATVARSFDSSIAEGVLTFMVLDPTKTRYVAPDGQEYVAHHVARSDSPLRVLRETKGALFILLEEWPGQGLRLFDTREVEGEKIVIGEDRLPFSELPSRGGA